MAIKSPGGPRKSTPRKNATAKKAGEVTPINQNNGSWIESNDTAHVHPGIEDEVRRRAYELYEERGRHEGFDQEDWARAEAEILSRYQKEKSA